MGKWKKTIQWLFVFAFVLSAACSKNPQLPSIDYNPQLVLFGVLAPGTYTLSETAFTKPLRYNFFVVQRTYKQRERLLLLPMENVTVWVDSVQMQKVGDLKQGIVSPSGNEVDMKTPIYSFNQKEFRIQALKTYTVRVSATGYKTISATTVVPEKPVILEPVDSTFSAGQKTIQIKWKKAEGAAGYRVLIWCGRQKLRWPCEEQWLNATVNTYIINLEDYYFPESNYTFEVDVQAIDRNYVNYLSLKENFFSACLTESSFNVMNGMGVLGALNQARKEITITK